MNETVWVKTVVELLTPLLKTLSQNLIITQGENLAYAYEIQSYSLDGKPISIPTTYETDILIKEFDEPKGEWRPRVVIEAKVDSVTTHDAITYSQKALNHKQVHPYLRYGIILGNRKHYPLPGRLFRHGGNFDFMYSWVGYEPQEYEINGLFNIIKDEIEASRTLFELIYSSRKNNRERYISFHKPLILK